MARPGPTGRANRGKGLEDALEAQHDAYAAQGFAFVKRQYPKVIKRGRRAGAAAGQALFAASPLAVDFMGALADGRGVAIEAKETAGETLRVDAVTEAQRAFMRTWPATGHLVVSLLIERRRRVYAVTFASYIAAWDARVPPPGKRRPPGRGSFGLAWFTANRPGRHPADGLRGVDWMVCV